MKIEITARCNMTRFGQQIICPFQPNVKKTQSITKQPITTHSVFTHSVSQQKAWNIFYYASLNYMHVHGFLCRIIAYYLILNTSSLSMFNMRSASFSLMRFQHRQGYNTNQAVNKIYCHPLQLDKKSSWIKRVMTQTPKILFTFTNTSNTMQ